MNDNPPKMAKMAKMTILELFSEEAQQIVKDCICYLCKGVFNEPYGNGECVHVFCKECISNCQSSRCPLCDIENKDSILDKANLKPVIFLINLIDKQQLCCRNIITGCKWKGQYRELNNHIQTCESEVSKCSNIYCDPDNDKKEEKAGNNHNCEYKVIMSAKSNLNELDPNLQNLQSSILREDNRGEKSDRLLPEEMSRKDNEEYYINCDYEVFGCKAIFKQTYLLSHLQNNYEEHHIMLVQFLEDVKNSLGNNLEFNNNNDTSYENNKQNTTNRAYKVYIDTEEINKRKNDIGTGQEEAESMEKNYTEKNLKVRYVSQKMKNYHNRKKNVYMLKKKQKREVVKKKKEDKPNIRKKVKIEKVERSIKLRSQNEKLNKKSIDYSFSPRLNNNARQKNCENNLESIEISDNNSNLTITPPIVSRYSQINHSILNNNSNITQTHLQNSIFEMSNTSIKNSKKTLLKLKENSKLISIDNYFFTKGLTLINEEITLTNLDPLQPFQFIILDYKLNDRGIDLNSYSPIKWNINFKFGCNSSSSSSLDLVSVDNWFAFGVCLKQNIENKLIYSETIQNGLFTVSTQGVLCHNNSSFKNNTKLNSFPELSTFDTVQVEYDYSKKEMNVLINNLIWKIQKVFSTDKNTQLYPCVILKNKGDSIKLSF